MLLAPTTTELRRLATEVDRFMKRLIAAPLASPGTPDLTDANDARHGCLDGLTDLRESLEAEIAKRGVTCCAECHATAESWGRFEAVREDALSQLDRVIRAERDQLHPDSDRDEAPWHSYSPPLHPVAVGAPTELGVLAGNWDAEGRSN